ncbi:MAG: hypothetical protein H7125_00825, partial [Proteobacteria bacterium]|nr:hypothetical protein [Burkholderiales bacterium]
MSVINQMLQDLERRHAGPADRDALPDEVRPLPALRDRRSPRRLVALGAVVVVSVAAVAAVAGVSIASRSTELA